MTDGPLTDSVRDVLTFLVLSCDAAERPPGKALVLRSDCGFSSKLSGLVCFLCWFLSAEKEHCYQWKPPDKKRRTIMTLQARLLAQQVAVAIATGLAVTACFSLQHLAISHNQTWLSWHGAVVCSAYIMQACFLTNWSSSNYFYRLCCSWIFCVCSWTKPRFCSIGLAPLWFCMLCFRGLGLPAFSPSVPWAHQFAVSALELLSASFP